MSQEAALKKLATDSEVGAITPDLLATCQNNFDAREANTVSLNAMAHAPALKVGLSREAIVRHPMTFSTDLKSGDITAQNSSGRCWMFAALNTLRLKAMEKMNLKTFELSQSYVMFWDKFERANYFLESILITLSEEVDSRVVMWQLQSPVGDGGQWDMFVNLVLKYGVVPKELYPESVSSSSTRVMNQHITEKLREYASTLREAHAEGKTMEELRELKTDMLDTIYRILTIHNGKPPTNFAWNWRDKDEKYSEHEGLITPQDFLKTYIDFEFDDYVSLIHCPTSDKPFNTHFTVDYLGNVVGGRPVSYLNVEMDVLKQATLKTLKEGEAVWFGCDVGKHLSREDGILDEATYRFDLVYNTSFDMSKGTRVTFGHSSMTHAMLFTGVHENKDKTSRWKVENSWGEKAGRDGFLVMSDGWFDDHLYQVLVPRKHVDESILKALDQEPVHLPPWDPMGSLAR